MTQREISGGLSALTTETQLVLPPSKFEQTFRVGIDLLRKTNGASTSLSELASLQYEYQGFDTALATLQDTSISPY